MSVSVTNLWPSRDEFVLQFQVVFDDAVVDDYDFAGAIAVRMGVFFGGAAMGGPASVADAVDAFEGRTRMASSRLRSLPEARRISSLPLRLLRRFLRNHSRDIQGAASHRGLAGLLFYGRYIRRFRTQSVSP